MILTLLLPFSQIVPIAASDDGVYVYGLESNEIKNSNAAEILVNLVNKKNENKKSTMRTANNEITLDVVENIAKNYDELDEIYTYQDEYVSDKIVFDINSSVYVLIEEDHKENTATITVDNTTFELKSYNSEKLSIADSNGNEMVIYEEIDEGPIDLNEYGEQSNQSILRAASWVSKSVAFHKTTKLTFEVLSWVGTIASGLTLTVTGPIGVVLYIYGLAVSVGQTLKPTIHIKYYHERRSDCSTYHRETRYYYGAYSEISKTFYEQLRNKNGSAKVTYNYFHSVDPSAVGGACTSY